VKAKVKVRAKAKVKARAKANAQGCFVAKAARGYLVAEAIRN
jgi:hypothetical protein